MLDSSRFSSLHPGYYVVFCGIYDTEPEAQSHVIEAHRRGYRGAVPAGRITPWADGGVYRSQANGESRDFVTRPGFVRLGAAAQPHGRD